MDNTPIRVFKNNSNIGVNYPSKNLVIQGSLWNGEGWAPNGRKIDWSQAPFIASFQGFNVDGCQFQHTRTKDQCYESNLWWNGDKYLELDPDQQQALQDARTNYMFEDYCSTNGQNHKECQI